MSHKGDEPDAVEPNRQQVVGLLEQLHVVNAGVRESALQTLARLSRETVIAILTECLTDPAGSIRADAAEVLLRLDAQRTLPAVMQVLNDPTTEMRWHVCGLLSAFGDARGVLPLATILRSDPDSDVRFNAALALRTIGDLRAIPALIEAQQDSGTDYEGRRIATMAREAIESIIARHGPQSSTELPI